MADNNDNWPEEGELLVCTVSNVRENGAYLTLDGYGSREGFVFVGEVASGWVKNIRNHIRVGQRVVAKVIGVKKNRERVDLSIKSVSEERRRDTIQSWKNEQRAHQIMGVVAERTGWDGQKTIEISEEMTEIFGTLYGALEECAISENALSDNGFSGDWMSTVIELAVENIIPPFVEIRGLFNIEVWDSKGVYAIQEALLAAEAAAEGEEDATLTCHYDGAPEYRVDIKAPDYETAERMWERAQTAATESIASVDGSIDIERM